MYRLFAALPVPPDITARLEPLQTGLIGASWRPPINFHITLRFFGDVSPSLARDLDLELAEIAADEIEIELTGIGWFGTRQPSAVWAGVAECGALRELSACCERSARRLGLPPDKRPFTPHITLAYLHGTSPEDVHGWAEARQSFTAGPFMARSFHLYSSTLGKGPSRYTQEADYVLK